MKNTSIVSAMHIQPQQILIPQQVYIGDVFNLRCTFKSSELSSVFNMPAAELKQDFFLDANSYSQESNYTPQNLISIKNIQLVKNKDESFSMDIQLACWQTGNIVLPPYDIMKAVCERLELQTSASIVLDFQPFNIISITGQNNIESLSSPLPPKMIPGTIYTIYFQIIFLFVVLVAVLVSIIKYKTLSFKIKNLMLLIKYRRNRILTIRELSKLPDSQIEDTVVADRIQQIMRKYLEQRFCYPFSKTVSSEIMKAWYEITQNLFSDRKNEAAEKIAMIFVRTDYIRYANSMALEESSFKKDEVRSIVNQLVECIGILESREAE